MSRLIGHLVSDRSRHAGNSLVWRVWRSMMVAKPSLVELQRYPTMARWFNPGLLIKLLWRVIVADVFGQYADRRLLEAALDTVSNDELVRRAQTMIVANPDSNGAVWVDFVADLGDGFD